MKKRNIKRILELLEQLKIDQKFYKRSLDRVCKNPTLENYRIYEADGKVLKEHERELYKLEHEGD